MSDTSTMTLTEIDEKIAQIDSQLAVMGKEEIDLQKQSIEADKIPFSARKVAIVGFAESSWRLAPWDKPDWEIWGLNGLHKIIKWTDHITRWFQIHPKESVFGEGKGGGADHVKFLQSLKIPVYMTQHYDEIPMSVEYPLKEICEWVSIGREKEKHPNLSNTISEMLALLAYEIVVCGREVDEVGVWGVDMSHSSEYCIAPETKVLTADLRWVQAKDIQNGQELIGFDENAIEENRNGANRRYRKCIVENKSWLKLPCYKLTMEDGTELICSARHKWLCSSAHYSHWMTTEELIPRGAYKDSRSSHILKPLEMWEEDNSYEAGYLAAAFDGEGHISQTPNNFNGSRINLGFAQRVNGMSETVEACLGNKKFDYSKTIEIGNGLSKTNDTYKYHIKCGKKEVLRFLGQIRPKRLLEKFDIEGIGAMRTSNHVAVIKKEYLGEQEVIGWKTSTHTFIAEGFASHNSYQKPSCEFYLGIFEGYRQVMEIFKRCGFVAGLMKDGQFSPVKLPFPTKWHLPKESQLLQNPFVYGYEEIEENADYLRMQARKNHLAQQRNANLIKEQESHDAQMQFLGAMQENESEIKNRGY
jgi:hypothetical protein